MATLIFSTGSGEQQVDLRGEVYVGRTAGNDVVLDDQGVSRQHCRFFVSEDGQAWVEDLNSANGVIVDGQRIGEPTPIAEGMDVVIGAAHVSLVTRRAAARPAGRPPSGALAKRGPSAPGRATRMMAAAEMPAKRARPSPHGSKVSGSASSRPRLTGNSGPWMGQVFDLTKPRVIVGRTSPADVLLEDDSVSRKHAEIYKTGSLIAVRDLGSANGTFVNGERIVEQQLSPGDIVRFGVVELAYTGPGAPRTTGLDPKKKKLAIIGGAGVLLLLVIVALGMGGGPPADGGESAGGSEANDARPPDKDPVRLLGQCKAYTDPDGEMVNWAKGVEVCSQVIELDPALTEARALERLAKKELGFEKIMEDAKLKVATSQDDVAIDLLTKIDSDSASFAKARAMFKEAAERVAKRSKTACVTDFKMGAYAQSVATCRRFLEVTCNLEGDDEKVLDMFQKSARRVNKSADFTCPSTYKVFGHKVVESVNKAEMAIRNKYNDPMVSMLILRYFTIGKPKYVSDEFKRLRTKKARQYGHSLDDIILQLDIIDGRYTSGQEGILRGDPVLTESYWKDAFAADKNLIPDGFSSALVKDMGRQLAVGFFKVGWDQAQKGNYKEAFKAYYKGYLYDKTNQDILLQLAGMERHAARELKNSPGCDSADLAMEITIPDGPVYKRAKEMKQDYGCP